MKALRVLALALLFVCLALLPVMARTTPAAGQEGADRDPAFEAHDALGPLAADASLTWNTFLGGMQHDYSYAAAVDSDGNVYVAGESETSWGSPVRPFTGGRDVFVAKLDGSGNLAWNTFLGSGGNVDYGYAIAVDQSGNVVVAGVAGSTWGEPVRAHSGGYDAFVAKLDDSSGALLWNTFIGGGGADVGNGVAVDASGSILLAGTSSSSWQNGPTPPVSAHAGNNDAFAAKLDSSGNLFWNTFMGGTEQDYGIAVAVEGNGNLVVAGTSNATWGSPIRALSGSYDAFATRLHGDGTRTWNTFLGSSMRDDGAGVAVDQGGNIYVVGHGGAGWGSPIRAYSFGQDTFVARLGGSGDLVWNTFLGGNGDEFYADIATDESGNVFVAGTSNAGWGTPFRPISGGSDAYAARLDSSGNLIWHAFLGGGMYDEGRGVAAGRHLVVVGSSSATWGSPIRAHVAGYDALVAHITVEMTPIANLSAANDSPTPLGSITTFTATVSAGSNVSYTWAFGDGAMASGQVVSHTYAAAGAYPAMVTASNSVSMRTAWTTAFVEETLVILPGGIYTTTDGGVTLDGSLAPTMTVTYAPQVEPGYDTGDMTFAGTVFQLQAADAGGVPITTTLTTPLTMTVRYEQDGLPPVMSEDELGVFRYDTDLSGWVPLALIGRDTGANSITGLLDHFSEFALLGPKVYSIYLPLAIR